MEFEFKPPTIISKTPVIVYAFQLSHTLSIEASHNERFSYEELINQNYEFISNLVKLFSEKCSKYFSKPLDATKLLSRLVHEDYAINVDVLDENEDGMIYEWKYTPYRIVISGTEFKIQWCIDQIQVKCVIEMDSDEIDGSSNAVNMESISENINEMKIDSGNEDEPPMVQLSEVDIPVAEDKTPVTIKFDSRKEDFKRLKKAQLRVKMARFKVERAYAKYIERWGYLSEDSGSESE
jgi:hypothetical protein